MKRKVRIRKVNLILFGSIVLIFGLKCSCPDSDRAIRIIITISYNSYPMIFGFSILISSYLFSCSVDFNSSKGVPLLLPSFKILFSRDRGNDTIVFRSSLRKLRISLCKRKEENNCKNKIGGVHIIWDFFGRN